MNPLHDILLRAVRSFAGNCGLTGVNAAIAPVPAHEGEHHAGIGAPLKMAKELRRSPFDIAQELAVFLRDVSGVETADAAKPGYVNITFTSAAIIHALQGSFLPFSHHCITVLDFGGPNIKPMHVGHLRSMVIGESLRRILQLTDTVISDIHWGDWGLPSGMILAEIHRMEPKGPWFTCFSEGPYPDTLPCSPEEIGNIYPRASARASADEKFMEEARKATHMLQSGDMRLTALWAALSGEAKTVILRTVHRLGVHFDYLLGESDAEAWMPAMLRMARGSTVCVEENGVLTVPVKLDTDRKEMPPLILQRADGSSLYAAADLATILQRNAEFYPSRIIYVVDERQHLHFEQVFRAASRIGISGETKLVHKGFGTVNGPDGKPFRTRSGSVMPLEELLDKVVEAVRKRIDETGFIAVEKRAETAEQIGLSALRVADLQQPAAGGYILDMEKAVRFEGNTGPFLLYAAVRLRSAVMKSDMKNMPVDVKAAVEGDTAAADAARALCIVLCDYPTALHAAREELEPYRVTRWAFSVADAIGRFWKHCPISSEPDPVLRAARTSVARVTLERFEHALHLLGCNIPEAM